jgi:hypothetical protein
MADKKLRFTPLSKDDLDPRNDEMLVRSEVAKRWDCSEKSVIRAETRLGLRPCRFMREVRYRFSDVLRIEREGFARMPRKWTALRPDQKDALLRREREELPAQPSAVSSTRRAPSIQAPA